MISRRKISRQEDANVWIAYTDLLTGLLTFFVILSFMSLLSLQELEKRLAQTEVQKEVGPIPTGLPGDAFFETGEAALRPEKVKELIELGRTFRKDLKADEVIVIQGHTDDQPYDTVERTNWELSGDRAAQVCRVFSGPDVGIPGKQLIIMGYSEFSPLREAVIAAGDSAEVINAKRAKNRRIEILKLKNADVLSSWKR